MGTASTMSQTNRSRCGCRSGRSGDRAGRPTGSFVISHTKRIGRNSSFHTPDRLSSFHTPDVKIRHFKHQLHLWITFLVIRHFTHHNSSLHTPIFVISHTDSEKSGCFSLVFQWFTSPLKTCNSLLTQFNSLAALQAAYMASAFRPITIMRPFAPLGRTRAPHHKKASGLTKSRTACRKRRPCFDRALRPSKTPFQGVGARHARSFASARGSAPAYRALETGTLLFFFRAQARDGSESRSTFIFWIRLQ